MYEALQEKLRSRCSVEWAMRLLHATVWKTFLLRGIVKPWWCEWVERGWQRERRNISCRSYHWVLNDPQFVTVCDVFLLHSDSLSARCTPLWYLKLLEPPSAANNSTLKLRIKCSPQLRTLLHWAEKLTGMPGTTCEFCPFPMVLHSLPFQVKSTENTSRTLLFSRKYLTKTKNKPKQNTVSG